MRLLKLLLIIYLCATAWPSIAGPTQDAMAAYQRGDYATALSLLRPQAERGDVFAQFTLGYMFQAGQGVTQDYIEAIAWYRRAADQGNYSSQVNLGNIYYRGEGVPQDFREAVVWYRKAAERGYFKGQASLGLMYFRGEGLPQDYVQAYKWLNLAIARWPNFDQDKEQRDLAVRSRDLVLGRMTQGQIAEAQNLAREWKPAP